MGIRTVAVYSDADARSRHVLEADEAVRLGPAAPSASYLRGDLILDAARATGAEAIHPGYGFLSENAAFAAACADAGVVFVGPPPAAMTAMGSKIGARRLMEAAGVPVVPGETPPDQTDDALLAALERVGPPGAREAVLWRRRHRHARRRRRRGRAARRSRRRGETRSTRSATARSTSSGCSAAPARRDPGVRRRARRLRLALRARMLDPAAPSEGRRGEPVAGDDTGVARPDGRGGRRRGACRGLSQCRHSRVPRRAWRHRVAAVLFPRDEHAPAGRAPGHRDGHRPRSRARAAAGRGGPAPALSSPGGSRSAATLSSCACMPKIPRAASCHRPDRCCSIVSRTALASGSTAASPRARR